MKTIDVVKQLRSKGTRVKYRRRKDGGILITSIDGISFKGAKGNTRARQLTGNAISSRQASQLKYLNPDEPKLFKARHRKKDTVNLQSDLMREFRKVQKIWRENMDVSRGFITKRNLARKLKEEGSQSAQDYLKNAKRYAKNLANEGNIDALIAQMKRLSIMYPEETAMIDQCIEKVDNARELITINMINDLIDLAYDTLKGELEIEDYFDQFAMIMGS